MEKPKPLEKIDPQELIEICQEYMDFIDDDEEYHEDNDYSSYIFEKAMEAVYGKDVWTFINARQE